jgi:hypothetical protein
MRRGGGDFRVSFERGESKMPAKVTIGGLVLFLLGWLINYWDESLETDAFDPLLEPLSAILRYGGMLILLAGLAWFGMLYYRRWNEKA